MSYGRLRAPKRGYRAAPAARSVRPRRKAPPRPRLPRPFAWEKSKLVSLKYTEEFTLNPGTGAIGRYTFRANGMFDPNYSGTGHQPYSFDQIMGLYSHFTVVGSKITLQNVESSTSTYGGLLGVTLHAASDDLTGLVLHNIVEHPGTGVAFMSGHQLAASVRESRISKNFSAKKFFGLPDIIGKADYRGDQTHDPIEQAYFTCWYACSGDGVDPAACQLLATIEYLAVFTEPRTLNSS